MPSHTYSSTTLHLGIQELALGVNILNRLLADAVALLLPRKRRVREHAVGGRSGLRSAGTAAVAAVAGLLVRRALGERDVDGGRLVCEGLAAGEVLGSVLEDLVRSREVGKLVVRGSGGDLCALDGDVEAGDVGGVDLAVDADDLVVEVLCEVGLDVLGLERGELAVVLLALEAGGEGKSALDHDGVRGVHATGLHATEDTVGTDVVGVLGVVRGRVVVGLTGAVAVGRGGVAGVGSGGVADGVWGSRVAAGGVATWLADEAVHSVGAFQSELVGDDRDNSVVVALLQGAAEVLASGVVGLTLAEGPGATAIHAGNGTSNLGVAAVAGLWVVVTKNAGLLDIDGSEVVASSVLGEGLERRVGVLRLARIPLSHSVVDVAVGNIGVGGNQLVHSKQTINVGVVEPEDGIKRRNIKVVHVATSLATSGVVDGIVNRLEAVDTSAAQISADTDGGSAGRAPRLLAGEESKNTVTERDALGIEASIHLVVVAASGVGDRATESLGPAVPWAATHLRWERAAEAVRVERVGNGDGSGGLGYSDGLVADLSGHSRLAVAWVHSPVPVRHAESGRGVPPALLLVGGEGVDDLLDALVPGLLRRC